jgi:hypothetical protein
MLPELIAAYLAPDFAPERLARILGEPPELETVPVFPQGSLRRFRFRLDGGDFGEAFGTEDRPGKGFLTLLVREGVRLSPSELHLGGVDRLRYVPDHTRSDNGDYLEGEIDVEGVSRPAWVQIGLSGPPDSPGVRVIYVTLRR